MLRQRADCEAMSEEQPEAEDGQVIRPAHYGDFPLVDSLNDAVVVADEEDRVVYANPATSRLLGWELADLRGSSLLRLVPERLRHFHEAAFARFVSSGILEQEGRPIRVPAVRADGTETPVELLISTLERPGEGRLVVGTLRDVRDRMDIERHRRVADQLLDILGREVVMSRAAPQVLEAIGTVLDWDLATLWIVEPDATLRCRHLWVREDGGLERFVSASLDTTLAAGEGLPGLALGSSAPAWVVDLSTGPDFPRRRRALEDGLRTALVLPVLADAEAVGVVELYSRELRHQEPALVDSMATIGERLGPFLLRLQAEAERERLLADLEASRRAQGFVLDTSRAMAEAKDYRQAIERLAVLAVPILGDLCLIDVVDENGGLRRMAARHADPSRQTIVDLLEREYPPGPGGAHPVNEVIASGRSSWSAEMSADFLARTTRDDRHLQLVSALGFASYMSVPLIAGNTVLGAVTLVSAGSGRRFSERDLALAESLASQVAAVVDNVRTYDIEHRIAHTLQRALLPDRLTAPDGLEVAARYLAATEGAEVGGDWYDVFSLPDGHVVTVVGDVEGHDMVAASVMAQLRSVLRAYQLETPDPGDALGRLSRFVVADQLPRMATVLVIVLDLETGNYTMASAGHHPPMLIAPPDQPRLLTVPPGLPLGVWSTDYKHCSGQLALGDILVLYTDGLVESRTTSIGEGVDRLARLASEHGNDPEQLSAALEDEMASRVGHEDDAAYLVIRRPLPQYQRAKSVPRRR